MHYHLTQEQRTELSLLMRLGHSQRNAALVLGVSPSTVCRELRRNRRSGGDYHAASARVLSRTRRTAANALRNKLLAYPKLGQHWSRVSCRKTCRPSRLLVGYRQPERSSGLPSRPSTTGCIYTQNICCHTCTAARASTVEPEKPVSGKPSGTSVRLPTVLTPDQPTFWLVRHMVIGRVTASRRSPERCHCYVRGT